MTLWLDKDMQGDAPASGKRGRQHTFSDAAIPLCLSITCLFGLTLRQSHAAQGGPGLEGARLQHREPAPEDAAGAKLPCRASTTARALLVDSTGIKFLGEDEWRCKKPSR